MIPFGLSSLMTLSLPISRRATKCLVPGASAIYLCNEGAGTTLTDYSGNGKTATFGAGAAAPTWTQYGISLDGGDKVEVGELAGVTAYAVEVVFYTASAITPSAPAGGNSLINLTINTGANNGGAILIGPASSGMTNEIVTLLSNAESKHTGWCDAAGSIAAGWHYLALTWNGANYDIYLDGVQKPVTPSAGGHTPLRPASFVMLGAARIGAAIDGVYLTGGIAAAAVRPSPLSPAQIAQDRQYFAALLARRGATPLW